MSYPFMPDINTQIPFNQYNQMLQLEQRVQKLERDVAMLKKQVNKKKEQPLTSKSELDLDNGIYMM